MNRFIAVFSTLLLLSCAGRGESQDPSVKGFGGEVKLSFKHIA